MSIWIDKDGRRHVGIMLNGTRVHRILAKGATAGDAKRLEAEIRASLGRRGVTIPGDPPLAAVMELYLEHAKGLRSADTSLHHANRAGPWVDGRRASEAQQAAAAMIQDMTGVYAPATINRSLGTLKKALKLAWERGMTHDNHGLRIKRVPEQNARDVFLSVDQVKMIADAASVSVRAAIWLALFTGCRRGELLALRKEDIGADSITIRASSTKTLRTRTVPIIAPARPWLKHVPLSVNFEGLKTGFRRAREKAGMPHVTFHDLRRSCGTLMVQAGVDLYVVSKVLGHSNVNITAKHYAHLQVDRMREGMERTFAPKRRRVGGRAES